MLWALLLLATPLFAQVDLRAIRELDDELPNLNELKQTDEEINFERSRRRYLPPKRKVSMEKILQSGTQYGAVNRGALVRNLKTNRNFKVQDLVYVKYFNLEDENGFKFIQNKNGEVAWRIPGRFVEPIKHELELYEPPLRYTPAPQNIVRTEYDQKLRIPPEFSFYAGVVQGDYMADLFEDEEAQRGSTNQFGLHFFTQWKLPVKAGAVVHYERSTYKGKLGDIVYSSPSFGPQFKTRDYEILGNPLRFQVQFRVGPFAKVSADGPGNYKFNSADLLASVERPIKNDWGEFVLGVFFQSQWLSIKDQPDVTVRASNATNKSMGFSLSQVFE